MSRDMAKFRSGSTVIFNILMKREPSFHMTSCKEMLAAYWHVYSVVIDLGPTADVPDTCCQFQLKTRSVDGVNSLILYCTSIPLVQDTFKSMLDPFNTSQSDELKETPSIGGTTIYQKGSKRIQ